MSKHMKSLNAPRPLKIHRKERKWTIRGSPGAHSIQKSIPLGIIIRNYLNLTDTLKEARRVLADAQITVDGTIRKEYKYPCGLMDVISIPKIKKDYRILYDRRGKLTLVEIGSTESSWKLCRIENKSNIKDNKIQLNLHDGRNIIVKKDEYKTGDVLKISFEKQKIEDTFKYEKGTVSVITGGSHIGELANIEDIETIQSSKPNLTKMKGKTDFTTLQNYVFQ